FFVGDSLFMDLCSGYVRRDMRRYQEYDFTFYSTQPNRCDDTSAVHIDVRTEPTLFLPNAFTPDGDGINDTWPGPVDIPEDGFEVQLFDRWGVSQWASIDTQAKWDGSLLPVGVYVYTMRHRDPCEPTQEVARNGTVTLIR
ncbi:MAG: gliding motility-associated C-terminal domain-containing protein, partial [Flavobacteriales bacterium]|nr:gliding motility-associated C-terminal domain-containing protein [Flavobacteriales bacterium]